MIEKYKTWPDARSAAKALGITSITDYWPKCHADPRLPVHPQSTYENFPGWDYFLGKGPFYSSLKAVAIAAGKLKITSEPMYRKRFRLDKMLMEYPDKAFPDFTNWKDFLQEVHRLNLLETAEKQRRGGQRLMKGDFYKTWQEFGQAAQKAGVQSGMDYRKKMKLDSRFPPNPRRYYADCPGWNIILGFFYATWQEARVAAVAIGLASETQYQSGHKVDPKLHSDPSVLYADFPGWGKFLQKDAPEEAE